MSAEQQLTVLDGVKPNIDRDLAGSPPVPAAPMDIFRIERGTLGQRTPYYD
jgi:hypothetical protein